MRKSHPPTLVPDSAPGARGGGKPVARSLTITRTLGALALLVIGGVHFQQYRYEFYSGIPTIGPLFLATFVAATALGLLLLLPVRRLGRLGMTLEQLAASAGLAVAGGTLVALLISEHTPLFGFREHGYRLAIVLALTSEAVAIATLTLFVVSVAHAARAEAIRDLTSNRTGTPPP
jgi:hypothetical protein